MAKKIKKIKHPLNKQQVEDFFNTFEGRTSTSKRNKLIFKTMLELGLRHVELANMKFKNIFKDEDGDPYFHLKAEFSKTGRENFLPMTKELYKELKSLKKIYKSNKITYIFRPISKDVPIQKRYIRQLANDHGVLAEIPFIVSSHTFRRTFANRILKSTGGNLKDTRDMMRHSNISTTVIYLNTYMEDKKRILNKVIEDNKI